MLKTTVGQVLVNQLLPEDMRDYGRVLDKKGLGDLLAEVGRRYPEKYRDVSFRLGQLGKEVAYLSGGNSFGLAAITKAKSAIARRKRMQILINGILADNSLSDEERRQQLIKLAQSEQKQEREEIFEESKSEKNPLAIQLMGAGRGSKVSLSSLRGSDWLYQDHRNNIIPVPVLRSYSEGLTPLEYWAGTYGARQGVYATKFATQEGGFFGKQLAQIAHRSVVTALDREKDPDTLIGFPVDADDNDNEGALLASPAGGYPRNTVLTPKILSHIRQQGIKRLLLRSPAVSGAPDGGLYARDAGHREFGQLPVVGEQLGMVSAQSLCLAEGTLVQMADGRQLPIEQIQPGDEVLGCSVEGVVRPTKVLALFDNGERPCIRAVFRRGTGKSAGLNLLEIVATCEHKILSEIVVRMAKYQAKLPYFSPVAVRPLGTEVRQVSTGLDYGDRFCAKLATTFDDTGLIDEPFALLLGLVIGDGSYTGCATSIGFSCYDSKLAADLADYLEKLEFGLGRRTDNEYYVKDLTHSNPKFREDGSYYRNRLKELLKNLEMWGQNSKTKLLPTTVHNWNNKSVAALLAGLLITDGYVITAGGIGFCSSSFQLLYGIRQLLGIRFGIWGSNILGSDKPRSEGHGFYDTCYKFSIHRREDVNLLRKLLPIAGVKDGRLDDLLAEWNQRQRNPQGVVRVRGRCSLISREAVGVRRVFDLYVAHPDHLFMLANGLIVSNSEPISQGMLCLREDTLVRMADFSVKPICQIRPGDLVLGANELGELAPTTVVRVYDNGVRPCFRTLFQTYDGLAAYLESTLDHKILACKLSLYAADGPAAELHRLYAVGDDIASLFLAVLAPAHEHSYQSGRTPPKVGYATRLSQVCLGSHPTFDLEVDNHSHLFVLANGLIVSNSTKHGGGVAGESKTVSGFDYLNSLVQVPKTFKGGAAHATVDGTVQQIAQAPAGGYYVTINDQQHYVGTGFSPRVKIGDKIEAGDVISDGIPNPAMATRYKGIGEGRRYFIQAFVNAMRDANMRVNRRNVETLSRGLINHVRLTEEMGDFIPDDIVPYSSLEHSYRPREGFRSVAPREAVGKYLERPYLHYTIGTKVRPSMLPEFTQFGVDKVDVHDKEPPFEPEMIRGMASLQHDPDWQTRMFGSGLKGSLLDAVHRGGTSEQAGTSFVPSRAKAVDFGKMGPIVTPKRNLGY